MSSKPFDIINENWYPPSLLDCQPTFCLHNFSVQPISLVTLYI